MLCDQWCLNRLQNDSACKRSQNYQQCGYLSHRVRTNYENLAFFSGGADDELLLAESDGSSYDSLVVLNPQSAKILAKAKTTVPRPTYCKAKATKFGLKAKAKD